MISVVDSPPLITPLIHIEHAIKPIHKYYCVMYPRLLLGNGLWLSKAQSQCLILWKKMPEWAAALHQWALSIGMQDAVTSVEEIVDGEDSRGTGMSRHMLALPAPVQPL